MSTQTFPEPDWCKTQQALEDCSSIASSGPTPFIISGVIKRLLQYHFSDPINIQKPQLKGYIWTNSAAGCISNEDLTEAEGGGLDDAEDGSRIYIDVDYKRDSLSVQQRPAVYVKREPVRTGKISFRNTTLAGLNENDVFEGTKHQVTIEGAHSLIVVGGSGTEADNLAEEVYFRMLHYMSLIRDDFRLGKFFVGGIGDIQQQPNEAKTAYYAIIRCEWAYVYRWLLIPETPIIKRLHIMYDEK